jgi:signal transduction histidine kinase
VQLHGGELKIRSAKGEGTAVEVSIPVRHADAAPPTIRQEPAA